MGGINMARRKAATSTKVLNKLTPKKEKVVYDFET